MRVNIKLLSELVKLSDGLVYFDFQATESVVFVAKDKKSVFIIFDHDAGMWDTESFLKHMKAVSAKNVLRIAKSYGENGDLLLKAIDQEIYTNGCLDKSKFDSYMSDIPKVIAQLLYTIGQPSEGSIMAYLPQSRDVKVVELLRDLYGEYNDCEVVFRFPNTEDKYKYFTICADLYYGVLYGMFTGMDRSMIEWY